MREILFRGKRKDNGEWVVGDLIHRTIWNRSFLLIRVFDSGFGNYEEYEVIPETVGQYTGLTDKNGKKIFEGDIWKRGDICGIVRWDFDEARFIVSYEIDGIEYQNAVLERNLKNIEVVGTIYDNPELLKGGSDNESNS